MKILEQHAGLYTDHYELTMAQGFFLNGMLKTPVNFDYFFRKNPFGGGYVVFAGLSDLLEILHYLKFGKEDIQYLLSIGFDRQFVEYLKTFKFSANIFSVQEGEIVFPNEQIFRVQGNIIECQLIETLVLNILNFESLIATKASRIKEAAGNRMVIDFGLRRAQGLGGIHASKACIIGGAESTSNVYSAFTFGLNSTGTMAHSWVQSFEDEYTAFLKFSEINPETCILLVDTYNTLEQGIPNAIKVAREMEKRGRRLFGIRLDSGDLAFLSKKSRKMLDDANLKEVKIVASNQLDEYVIKSLNEQKAPIDTFGVGTSLITGRNDGALDGVYKLSMSDNKPRLKLSENIEKIILPGIKKIIRYSDEYGAFYGDGILLDKETDTNRIYHPQDPDKFSEIAAYRKEPLMGKVMEKGRMEFTVTPAHKISEYRSRRLKQLPEEHKRFTNPHRYKVGISPELMKLRDALKEKIKKQ